MSNGTTMATVRGHDSDKIAPVLTPGALCPAVIQEWQTKASAFFSKLKIPANNQVSEILNSFKDQQIISWIGKNRAQLTAEDYNFTLFMKELRALFLDPDWEHDIIRSVLNTKMSPSNSFSAYAEHVITGNNLLRGTDACLDDSGLKNTMTLNMTDALAAHIRCLPEAERSRLSNLRFKLWVPAIARVDNALSGQKRHMEEIAQNMWNKHPKTEKQYNDYDKDEKQTIQYASGANATSTGSKNRYPDQNERPQQSQNRGNNAEKGGKRVCRCPFLTDEERKVLSEHDGCFKCRMPYTNHFTRDCPTGFPSPDNYETRMHDWCLRHKPNAVASVHVNYNNERQTRQSEASTSRAHITAVPETPPRSSIAVLPSVNFVLEGNDSDFSPSPSPKAASDRENVSPFFVPHLRWKANYFSTASDFPVAVDSLIDDACPYVLIRPDIVIDLGLCIKKLKKIFRASSAFSTSEICFENFVTLQPSSLNNAWSSKPVQALIANDLCAPIILGLPFLQHNQIVIDYEHRSILDKKCNFNLLNEDSFLRPPEKKITPHIKRKNFAKFRQLFVIELKWKCEQLRLSIDAEAGLQQNPSMLPIAAVITRIEQLACKDRLIQLDRELKDEFKEVFEPIPHSDLLPTNYTARIKLKDAEKKILSRSYTCPRQFKEAFATLIDQRLDSGFIRRSTSEHLSPSFIIPKADPKALPRWVCDYRQLNANTVPDNYPLPRIDEILSDCAKGRIWAKLDMTDSFFQTRMHPDDIKYTAVSTPQGAFEWLVMPMGFRNAPAIHQRRVAMALQKHIGKICHVYLDDIIIWSQTAEEHIRNVKTILNALKNANLYANRNKTSLFCHEINFLGHKISHAGIEADNRKVEKILNWPRPKSATEVRRFLGLVRYLSVFLPRLAIQSEVLTALTLKSCEKHFPEWTQEYEDAFETIKSIVVSRECLTVIDHDDKSRKIYLTTDASDTVSGAVLSFGPTWETARPVAFDSMTFKGPELNYPVHEKELLAILRALRKWKMDLIGSEFYVYTDHKTLLNFNTQKDLSRRQARWMEELAIYNCKFVYVKGEENTVADALSRYPQIETNVATAENLAHHPYHYCNDEEVASIAIGPHPVMNCVNALCCVAPVQVLKSEIHIDRKTIEEMKECYKTDPWCLKLISASKGMPELTVRDGLWFIGDRLVVPNCRVREKIFAIAHDALGHFGFKKTYQSIRDSYFWPNMRTDLENGYIPSCIDCQRNKSSTTKPSGPLHPLPIPDERCESIAMDFIGPLPLDDGCDYLLTITDRLGSDLRFVPTTKNVTAEKLAVLFFDN